MILELIALAFCSNYKARMKIYSVSTRYYFAFGARITRKTALKLKGKSLFHNFSCYAIFAGVEF